MKTIKNMSAVRKARAIWGAVAALGGIALIVYVCMYWWTMEGCGFDSLAAAIAFYAAGTTAVWSVFDQIIKEGGIR